MRKLIWYCSAAGVLAAGGFLSLAYYACRFPDSVVGRSMQVVAKASVAMQPLSGLTSMAVRTNRAKAGASAAATPIDECIPDDPKPVGHERVEEEESRAQKEDQFLEFMHDIDVAPIVIHEDDPMPAEETAPAIAEPIEMAGIQGHEIPPKGCPIAMPYCEDEEEEPVPSRMPHADSSEETEHTVFKAWIELFEECKQDDEDNSPIVEQLPPPTEDPQTEPKCQEDSHLHGHYPGCPYTGKDSIEQYYKRVWNLDPEDADPKTKKKGSEESSEEPHHPAKKPHHGKDECPRTRGVDTMEYRKSDAGLNEIGPGPVH